MSPDAIESMVAENRALKSQLLKVSDQNGVLTDQNADLRQQLEWLKRQVFGQKTERYIPSDDNQIALALGVPESDLPEKNETITYDRKKPGRCTPHGREEIPAHLPRNEIVIMPEEDVSGMERIGEKVTEQLEYTPPKYSVNKYVRPVFAGDVHGERTVVCGELPKLCSEKGKYGASIIAHAVVSKFEDHLPLYRLQKVIARDSGVVIPESSLDTFPEIAAFWLEPIVRKCAEMVMGSGYIQMDESTLKVMIQPTSGKSTTGQMWVRHAPEKHVVIFDYERHRNGITAKNLLGSYEGVLQTDGLATYDQFSVSKSIVHAGCHAHARRGFDESKSSDHARATHALSLYQKLFAIESEAKALSKPPGDRLILRQEKSAPIVAELKLWLDTEVRNVRPKSPIGKAIQYCLNRWHELTRFLHDGRIEMSNNLVENCIRPLAIGRKNWMFAGSPEAARKMAILLTIIGTCKLLGVNSFKYLAHVLAELPKRMNHDIDDLLPWNWNPQL
jgi:transposase